RSEGLTSGAVSPSEIQDPAARLGSSEEVTIARQPMSDDVALGARAAPVEALGRERRDIHERLALEHEVAQDLADGGALQEAVPREAGRVQEARHAGRLAEQRVVVR